MRGGKIFSFFSFKVAYTTMFDTREEAEKFLKESNVIPSRLECIVTEHEFVRVHPAREKNLKDALTGLR